MKLIRLLLIVALVKTLAWSLYIPLWQFPDEQAHFGHVAYLAEGGTLPMGRKNDQNEEVVTSEEILGTVRDENGNNRYTYHPEYNIEYASGYDGLDEAKIKNLPVETRKNFIFYESAYYPHFFYYLSGVIYKLFYNQDIFVRVFALRIFWLIPHLVMVWLAYLVGKEVFPKQEKLALSAAILTAFQPMLTFTAAGLTSDSLHNVLFTAVIYFCLKLFKRFERRDLFGLAVVLAFGFINKPQFLVALGIVVPVLVWRIIKDRQWRVFLLFVVAFLVIVFVFDRSYFLAIWDSIRSGQLPFMGSKSHLARPDYTLWQHLVYTANHTFREVLPWYWGVFRWLSLTLPRWVNQVMMRLLLLSGLGLMIKIIRHKFEPGFWLIVWSAFIYFAALFLWDYQQVRNAGFPFGIQGRYYFPVIVPHMILLIMGIKEIWHKLVLVLDFWFIALNWIAFYWVTSSYYSVASLQTFIIQASQYKPDFAKGWWLISALFLYFLLSVVFSIKLLKNEK